MQVNLGGMKVMVAIPGGRNPDWSVVVDLLKTDARLREVGVSVKFAIVMYGSIITKVRDELVDEFLNSECDRMFWIDDDMRWTPDDFVRLLALSTQVDCVAAGYPAKKEHPTFFVKTTETGKDIQLDPLGLFEIAGIGLGFACMTRKVVEAVAATKPVVFDQIRQRHYRSVFRTDITDEGNFRGEDMAFFQDIRDCGFKVWCDPSIDMGHMGTKEYRGRMLDILTAPKTEATAAAV